MIGEKMNHKTIVSLFISIFLLSWSNFLFAQQSKQYKYSEFCKHLSPDSRFTSFKETTDLNNIDTGDSLNVRLVGRWSAAKLNASCKVKVLAGKGLAIHPYRVLRMSRRCTTLRTYG